MTKVKVLIVDDSKLVWEILKKSLFTEKDITLLGFASNGSEALELMKNNLEKPDVVIMDLVMPVMGGIKAIEEINKHFSKTKVIILTNVKNPETALYTVKLGAKGYILKNNIGEDLASVIRAVHQGYALVQADSINNLVQNSSAGYLSTEQENIVRKQRKVNPASGLPVVFWLIVFIGLINSISFTIIIPLIYPYAKQFALSDFQASLLISSFALSQFFGTPILGKLSDLLGRKYILVFSLMGTVIANLLASMAGVAWLLYLSRILDGLTGGNNSVASAVISDITTPEQRAKAFGIFGATFRLGFVIGPILSYLAQQLPTLSGISSLGMSFMISAAIAAFATVLTILFLPETNFQRQKFQLDWSDFTFGKVVFSLSKPRIGKLFILTFFSGLSFTIFTFAFQPFFLNVLNQDAKGLAIVFASVGILGFISQIFALEPLRKRFNLIDIIGVSLFIRGITFLLLPVFPTYQGFVIILIAFGLVNSFPMPLIDTVLSLNSDNQDQGEILSINSSYFSISSAIGPVISGVLVSQSYSTPFLITGAFTILVAAFAFNLKLEFVRGNL
ncbi:MFS transporter [Waterburya agarophytonicola K14]|uniref:MFS transporter n=1 Tax=Waterburya agarophytonicola KI4 TaxID=2874699 RepID=A0A964BP11_9CYAN|nr:MFS transporter [Waterburya agarophytonicola]MCC0175868.1 MFS transporter [Waterburya agarophytonicola KI4]